MEALCLWSSRRSLRYSSIVHRNKTLRAKQHLLPAHSFPPPTIHYNFHQSLQLCQPKRPHPKKRPSIASLTPIDPPEQLEEEEEEAEEAVEIDEDEIAFEDQQEEEEEILPLNYGVYIMGTPIGNLEDISLRALRVLQGVSRVCCEDTRKTRILLQQYNIVGPLLVSLHAFSTPAKVNAIIQHILETSSAVAVVSDAGMSLNLSSTHL